jgi:cytochrome b561
MSINAVSGYLASNFSKYGIILQRRCAPALGIDDKRIYAVFNTTHIVTSYVSVALIVIRDRCADASPASHDVFERMWPGELAKAR